MVRLLIPCQPHHADTNAAVGFAMGGQVSRVGQQPDRAEVGVWATVPQSCGTHVLFAVISGHFSKNGVGFPWHAPVKSTVGFRVRSPCIFAPRPVS